MILCCDLPRGKFPYLVFQPRCLRPSRLVLCDASHVGNASFAILVCTSIRTRLRFFLSIFCSRRPLPQHSLPFLPILPTLFPMSTQSPPVARKSTTGSSQGVHISLLYHIGWVDGAHGNVCVPRVSGSNSAFRLPCCWGTIGLVCTHSRSPFSNPFFRRIISRGMYSGLGISTAQSHARPSCCPYFARFFWSIKS